MTIRVCISGAASKRQTPQSPEYHFSSDPCFRVPPTGTVSAVHVKTVGAVVQAGTMLAEIVPTEAEYLVRAQINPQGIADVQPGQMARISLAAYDPSRYGVVMGVVRRVATNTTQPENVMPF